MTGQHIAIRAAFSRFFLYCFLIRGALFFLMPVYVLLVTGLKSFKDVNIQQMWSLPAQINPATFLVAFEKLSPNLKNSLVLTIPATLIFVHIIYGIPITTLIFRNYYA